MADVGGDPAEELEITAPAPVNLTENVKIEEDDNDDEEEEEEDSFDAEEARRERRRFCKRMTFEEMDRLDAQLDKEILIYSAEFDPIDITHAIHIVVDPVRDFERQGVPLDIFDSFFRLCLDRNTLQVYDHPGDPRLGGFEHWEGGRITEYDRETARFAIDEYQKRNKDAHLRFLEVDKMSANVDFNYYVTFRAIDETTNQ